MRTHALEPVAIPGEVIAGSLIAAGLTLFGWILRVALRETLRGIETSLSGLRKSVDNLANKLDDATDRIAEHDSRLAVAEDRLERLGRGES